MNQSLRMLVYERFDSLVLSVSRCYIYFVECVIAEALHLS